MKAEWEGGVGQMDSMRLHPHKAFNLEPGSEHLWANWVRTSLGSWSPADGFLSPSFFGGGATLHNEQPAELFLEAPGLAVVIKRWHDEAVRWRSPSYPWGARNRAIFPCPDL